MVDLQPRIQFNIDGKEMIGVPVAPPPPPKELSPLAKALIETLKKSEPTQHGKKIAVNPVVAKFASWLEKLRNVMEYREEEVMLRAAIERILRRRLLLGGNAKTTAEPLVRELIWARYLADDSIPENVITKVEQAIDLHLRLRMLVIQRHSIPDSDLNELMYALMSSDIEHILRPRKEKEAMANFMFQALRDDIVISDDSEQTRDAQVYIAVRRAFARDDEAFVKYHLLQLFFGKLNEQSLQHTATNFMQGYQELLSELRYPQRERIYTYVKRRSAVFLILEDILRSHKKDLDGLVGYAEEVEKAVYNACEEKYATVSSKVKTAIMRSIIFLLLTKVVFAFAVEGTYERIFYGEIMWTSMLINIIVPPIIMMIVGLFLRAPGAANSARILDAIKVLLYSSDARLGDILTLKKRKEKPSLFFSAMWLVATFISFGGIVYILRLLHFNFVSIGVFIFFLAIVSFLAYRISLTANLYRLGDQQGFFTPFVDFFFMPVIRVGRGLALNISKINILLFVFDFLIETPFKMLFAFFEQWFIFLHAKREELE